MGDVIAGERPAHVDLAFLDGASAVRPRAVHVTPRGEIVLLEFDGGIGRPIGLPVVRSEAAELAVAVVATASERMPAALLKLALALLVADGERTRSAIGGLA